MNTEQDRNGGYEPTEVEQRAALINEEQESYQALINTISGGKHTFSSLEKAIPYEKMQEFNQHMAADRQEASRKAASSQRRAAQIILNA